MKHLPQKCSLQAQRKSDLQTKTGLQRVQSWPCSATTQAALPIVRKRPLIKATIRAIRQLRRRGIGGFARRIPAARTVCAMSTLRGALNDSSAFNGSGGVRPLCNLKSDILVSDNKNSRGNYEFQWNAAPSTPDGISVPESCYSTQNITVTWGASTDPDGDTITYVLERSVNNGSYTQATATAARTFTETVSTSWNTIKYRVKARDTYGNESAYVTSSGGSSSSQSAARHFRTKRRSWNEKRRLLLQVHCNRSGRRHGDGG